MMPASTLSLAQVMQLLMEVVVLLLVVLRFCVGSLSLHTNGVVFCPYHKV